MCEINVYILFTDVFNVPLILLNNKTLCVFSQEPVKRILALTETCLVERDPASYNIVTLKPFGEVSPNFLVHTIVPVQLVNESLFRSVAHLPAGICSDL